MEKFKVGDKVRLSKEWWGCSVVSSKLDKDKSYKVLEVKDSTPIRTMTNAIVQSRSIVAIADSNGTKHWYGEGWFVKDNREAIDKFIESCKWKPKDGERYWYVESWGVVYEDWWYDCCFEHRMRYRIGNCFKTREQARDFSYEFKGLLGGTNGIPGKVEVAGSP